MRYSPHPPSPLLPHVDQGEPPQIRRPDAVGSPAPAQGAGLGVRATAKTLHLRGVTLPCSAGQTGLRLLRGCR